LLEPGSVSIHRHEGKFFGIFYRIILRFAGDPKHRRKLPGVCKIFIILVRGSLVLFVFKKKPEIKDLTTKPL